MKTKSSAGVIATLLLAVVACAPAVVSPPTTPAAPAFIPAPTQVIAARSNPTSHSTPTVRPSVTPIRTPSRPDIQTPPWFRDVVLYEIFPRSWYDSNGDGIGDLKGITKELDYLKDLGVGALWLTPIFASPSYHGYDITDYYKINPEFGSDQDLTDLVGEAHKRNIRVLLDYVVAHTSNQHPFFKDAFGNPASPYSNYYRWTNPQHTTYESFAGVKEMPQLNQSDPALQKYLIDMAKYWMTKSGGGDPRQGIDGYRCDYVLNVPGDFWKALRRELKSINPDFVLLGEAWTGMLQIAPYYDDEFDATFDFPVYGEIEGNQDQIGDSLLLGGRSPSGLDGSFTAKQILFPRGAESVVFINNHDTNRVMSEVKGDTPRAKLGALLYLTQPGTPMVYYGEEIGMSGARLQPGEDDKTRREPMDWFASENGPGMTAWYKPSTRFNKPNDGVSVEEELGKGDSLLAFYRSLIALRNANAALRTGTREEIRQDNTLATAYLRRDDKAAFVIALNLSDKPITLRLDLGPTTLPDGEYKAVDVFSKRAYQLAGLAFTLDLAGESGTMLQLVR